MYAKMDQTIDHKEFILQPEAGACIRTNVPLTFLSAFCIALSRIANTEDVTAACVAAVEDLPESWHSVASTMEAVPLAFHIGKHARVSSMVDTVIDLPSSSRPRQLAAFSVEFLNKVGDRTEGEVFDLEYSYFGPRPYKAHQPLQLSALRIEVCEKNSEQREYQISFSFNPVHLTSVQIEKIYELWLSIVKKHLESRATMRDLDRISPDERHQVTILFNRTESKFARQKCIPDLLWNHVRERPDDIAVISGVVGLTYKELARRSLEISLCLRQAGVRPDDPVGVFVEPCLELMTCIWGILASGGAYLPLAPEYPQERLRYMIADSRTKVIVTQASLKEKLLDLAPAAIRIITPEDVKGTHTVSEAMIDTTAPMAWDNLAYVIYTSGSTGKPKGVMIEHHSIVNQMCWMGKAFGLDRQKTILQKSPISFDAAQWEILAPACGSTVVMGNPGSYKDPEQIIAMILQYNVTTLQCVPTLLQGLLDTGKLGNCRSLAELFVGGEALPARMVAECYEQLPTCRVINLYGPTECTINSSAFMAHPESIAKSSEVVSIGAPVSNTQYYILDNCDTPVPIGEIGELYIGGEGVARGYLHHPDLTEERFIPNPLGSGERLYRTGDLALWNADGTVQFCGRADNQIKLRGFRIELDEIRSAIETHDWIKTSAIILKSDPFTQSQNLIAFIELDPTEAALMDQGNHDAHHQSKESKAQVLMQLANKGCREQSDLSGRRIVNLPGKTPTAKQRREVFARKTYRFFEGGKITKQDMLRLLEPQVSTAKHCGLEELSNEEFGEMLRYFGQYINGERLLPKYGYASPGALYPTQIYLEVNGIGGLQPGFYYYNPREHQLALIKEKVEPARTELKLHFIGKRSAIDPIYKHNILEVMEIETGHIIGLFERILSNYGLSIDEYGYVPPIKGHLDVDEADFYLGSFQITSGRERGMDNPLDVYVQLHSGRIAGLKTGLYHYREGDLVRISDEIVLKKHVIAINQEVFERAAFAISLISRTDKPWLAYVNLGRELQRLQMNHMNFGFMSSGYSSKTGYDLPSAKRIRSILNADVGPSYFFVGGRLSDEQKLSEGMKEDIVHMRGPAEMITDDLANVLPDYMIPNKVIVVDRVPLTANGKIDRKALEKWNIELVQNEYVAPRSEMERRISEIWQTKLRRKKISITDNFFQAGGNSLLAVSLVHQINEGLNVSLPLQVLFEAPTIEKLALKIESEAIQTAFRLIPLQGKGAGRPIYCWPGLGGYCSNLQLLAKTAVSDGPFYGVQTYGINKNEISYPSIQQMAAEDIRLIREMQPEGPYTLWGYSFGARVAFETTYQLEQAGETVDNLVLIAPGSPKIQVNMETSSSNEAVYRNKIYVAILFSVFMGNLADRSLCECLRFAEDEERFIEFITGRKRELGRDLVKRIIDIVALTYGFAYSLSDLSKIRLNAPITIVNAKGDNHSFIENSSHYRMSIVDIDADHYSVLKEPAVNELVKAIERSCSVKANGSTRPELSHSRATSAV